MPRMLSFSRRKALYAAIMRRNGIHGRIRFQPMPQLRQESDIGAASAPTSTPDLSANPQPAYGESLRESERAIRARRRDEQHWPRRLLAAPGLS